LLGRYPAAQIEVAQAFSTLPPPVQAGLPSALLNRRPDIVAAERQVLEAFRMREAAKLALLPDFALTVTGGYLSDQLLSLLRLNPWLIGAGIGMSVPLYTGGALQAKVEIATARQSQAVARYGNVALTSFGEVEAGLTNERLFSERLGFDRKALADRTEAVRIATLKYKAGSVDLLTVLVLQGDEISSRVKVVKLHGAQRINRVNLHLALGGDFGPPIPAQ
jgi:outer membrane protein, multidrug efflux system